jgi:uncharacterized protein involved in copper resistance
MISRRRFLLAPIALLTPLALGQETAASSPLVQHEEHQTLPPPTTIAQVVERLVAVETDVAAVKTTAWVNTYSIRWLTREQARIWQHLIPTGWWRPRLKRPI